MGVPLHQRAVPAAFTVLLFEHLENCGQDAEAVLGMPWPSADPEERSQIDVRRWDEMLCEAERHLDDPYIGLRLGQMVTARHLGVAGHMLLTCDHFGAVLQQLEKYQRLIFDVIPMQLQEREDSIDVVWDISQFRTGILVGETGFATMVQFCRNLMQGEANPLAIEFAHPRHADLAPYEDFFQCPVLFDRPAPIIRAGRELLTRPLKSTDTILQQVLEQHAQRLLDRLPKQEELITQVRQAIAKALRLGVPDIQAISQALGQSSRTLQRRLLLAGSSFREELKLVRSELAQAYLQDPQISIADIAQSLGYSEHSAFTRAFKKETGATPQDMRDRLIKTPRRA
ncbi:MAG: AraC family transcriptional regulator ligand-binding domain-containing protein [Oceanococcaceae bacterium]